MTATNRTTPYDWDRLATELAARTAWDTAPRVPADRPQGTHPQRDAGAPAHALLHDLADPTLSLADLTHIHRAPVTALRALTESPEFREAADAYHALATLREQLIATNARASAIAALAECAASAPNHDTRRKAAASLLASGASPDPRPASSHERRRPRSRVDKHPRTRETENRGEPEPESGYARGTPGTPAVPTREEPIREEGNDHMNAAAIATGIAALAATAGLASASAKQVLVAEYTENFSVTAPPGDLSINIFSAVAIPGLFDPFDSQYLFGVENITNGDAGTSFLYDLTQPPFAPHVARLTDGADDELWLGADNQGGWGDYRTRSESSLFAGAPAPDGGTLPGPDLAGFIPTTVEMAVNSISLTDNGFEIFGNASVTVRYYAEVPLPDPFDISGVESWDGEGDPDNTILVFDLAAALGLPSGTPVRVLSYGYDISITTVGASWASEIQIGFDIEGTGTAGLTVRPALGDEFPVTNANYTGGPSPFTDNVSPDGLLRVEFSESFDDNANAVDAFFEPGSRLIFELEPGPTPCSAADLVLDFGVLDLNDITAFVAAFTAGDPLADLNSDGIFDLADITGFVTLFNMGCP
jgi:hypothetical protein